MLPHTLDNHFVFGYGSELFNSDDRSPQNTLWCSYSRCAREPRSFKDECISVAKGLAAAAASLRRVPMVLLSGGLDSEVVAKAFIEADVDFEAITFRFKDNLNAHETKFVKAFVKRNGIKHRFFDIDILSWIQSSEMKDFFDGAEAASLNLLPHMKLMNHVWNDLNGMPILGNGDLYLENDGGWNYVELEYMLSWYRHAIRFGILGGIGFFQHTPEVTLAMMREPKIERLGRNLDAYANKVYDTSRFVKYGIYRKHWPDLEIRPKFAGNEFVKKQYDARTTELLEGKERWLDKWVISYDDFRSMLEPNEQAFRQNAGLGPRQTDGQWKAGS